MPEDTTLDSPTRPRRAAPRRRAPHRKPVNPTPGAEAERIAPEVEDSKGADRPGISDSAVPSQAGIDSGSRLETGRAPDERAFDELVNYGSPARDLDRLAASHPRTAVIGALAAGFLIGFGVGVLAARD